MFKAREDFPHIPYLAGGGYSKTFLLCPLSPLHVENLCKIVENFSSYKIWKNMVYKGNIWRAPFDKTAKKRRFPRKISAQSQLDAQISTQGFVKSFQPPVENSVDNFIQKAEKRANRAGFPLFQPSFQQSTRIFLPFTRCIPAFTNGQTGQNREIPPQKLFNLRALRPHFSQKEKSMPNPQGYSCAPPPCEGTQNPCVLGHAWKRKRKGLHERRQQMRSRNRRAAG